MCEWGDTVDLAVPIPANLSCTGERRIAVKPIDRCIAGIVKALNDGGVPTVSSCCGHGKNDGSIVLEDGRELIIRHTAQPVGLHEDHFPKGTSMLRAKFSVGEVAKNHDCRRITLSAVSDNDGTNADWSKYTPAGELTMTITNEAAFEKIDAMTPGDCFYIDITPVPAD